MAGGLAAGIVSVALFSIFPIPSGLKDGTNIIIPLERTIRFGSCPAHHVALHGNGAVMYEDESFVAVKGAQKPQVNPETVKGLIKEFYNAGFFSLRDRYEALVTDFRCRQRR